MEQVTQCTVTTGPVLQSPHAAAAEACVPWAHAPQQEKPLQRDAPAPQLASSPRSLQLEKSLPSNKDPESKKKPKNKTLIVKQLFSF